MLLLASSVCGLFKWRQFEPEVILLAVGWYLRFSLSYRDVEELLAERGLHADHVTVWRWVQRYAPELQRCLRRHLKPTNDCWRVDFDLHPGERQVALPLSGGGFHRRHPRLPSLEPSRTRTRLSAFRAKVLSRSEPSRAAGDQHRRPRRVSARRPRSSKPTALSPRIAGIGRCHI
jgi:hypothetical protein